MSLPGAARYLQCHTLYEGDIAGMSLGAFGTCIDVTEVLTSGRSNYILFQALTGLVSGLSAGSEGSGSDLRHLASATNYEVKAFEDVETRPGASDWFHTAASSTFGANNKGPEVSALLAAGDYASALAICRATGYDKNDFYIYTNTRKFIGSGTMRYLILPTSTVLTMLSPTDPRLINRKDLLAACTRTVHIDLKDQQGLTLHV